MLGLGGGDHESFRHGQQRASRSARLKAAVTLCLAQAFATRFYQRRFGCRAGGLAGQRAAVARRRIGKIVLRPAGQAGARRNNRQRGSPFGAGRTCVNRLARP